MSEAIKKKIYALKSTIVDSCKVCAGGGYVPAAGTKGALVPCKCMAVFQYLSRLIVANIPQEYWFLHYSELTVDAVYKKAVEFYIEHINTAVAKSAGIFFLGHNGVGKTTLMCEIGKHLIARGYSVSYFTIEEYINAIRTGQQVVADTLCSAEALLIDEIGKVYEKQGSTFVIDTIESCLRKNVVLKPVIMCSNFSEPELREMLGDSTMSVLERHLKFIDVEGKDFSSKLQDRWKQDLFSDVDYYHTNIWRMATIFIANQARNK